MIFDWQGGGRFALAYTEDGYELRCGVSFDRRCFIWAVYLRNGPLLLARSQAPTMRYGKRQAEVFVEQDRADRRAKECA